MTPEELRYMKARNLRYKRPALAVGGWNDIAAELEEIQEACDDVRYYIETENGTLLNGLLGNEDEAEEFKLEFCDLSAKAEQLGEVLYETAGDGEENPSYDDCTVALLGNRYSTVGYDTVEEDYFSLCGYDAELAGTEAGKRLMRLTKKEMISTIGQALGVFLSFIDLRQQYDYLKAAFDVLRSQNGAVLRQVKEIDAAYEAANAIGFRPGDERTKHLDCLLEALPDRAWVGG